MHLPPNMVRRQPLHVQPVKVSKAFSAFSSEELMHGSDQQMDRLLAHLSLQDGVVAHLDRLKTARNMLGNGDLRARIEKLLRY